MKPPVLRFVPQLRALFGTFVELFTEWGGPVPKVLVDQLTHAEGRGRSPIHLTNDSGQAPDSSRQAPME